MKRKLIIKIGFLLSILAVFTLAILALFTRKSVLESSEETALTVAELVRDTLTSYMVLGVIDRRDVFLNRVKSTHGLEWVRVIRGEAVVRQFGRRGMDERTADALEIEALRLGERRSDLIEDRDRVIYRLVIPYKAERSCITCHQVKEGEVLGAISLGMDLTSKRAEALTLLTIYGLSSIILFVIMFYVVKKHFEPYDRFMREVKTALSGFKEGDFGRRVRLDLGGEVGELAKTFNLVGEALGKTLSTVREKVSTLLGYRVVETENDLRDTEKIIDELVKISNFKRTVEQDLSKEDIYSRLEHVLSDYMSLDKFSIYEVDGDRNRMTLVTVHGEKMWCSEAILENPDECRAKRTGQDVDSTEFPCICPRFAHHDLCFVGGIQYYCIPLNLGGRVGNVVQIVYESDMDMFVRMLIPYIKGYLQEAAPVLESRRLMELLQRQSYIDQLTGLYNRRFLEEIGEKLSAQIRRRGTCLGVLMVDIDYFKRVNDEYGHDAGDRVLREIAAVVKENVREADYVIRFGGEEILVLLMDIREGEAEEVAEKIRKAVEGKRISFSGGVMSKTVSVGVSEFPKDCEGKLWQCIKFADVALYRAKEEGRNRVVRFLPEMWKTAEY